MNIPSDIVQWDKADIVSYYLDTLRWNLIPLRPRSKEPVYKDVTSSALDPAELRKELSNGANIGVYPGDTHVIIDLDSKADQGESVMRFLNGAGPRLQTIPRERTRGGVHLHLRVKDLPIFPEANKLVCPKITPKVIGEMFLRSRGYVVTSPSVHESGHQYA
jgi:hypothetical protein